MEGNAQAGYKLSGFLSNCGKSILHLKKRANFFAGWPSILSCAIAGVYSIWREN